MLSSLFLFSVSLLTIGCNKSGNEKPDIPTSKDNTYIIISDLHLSDKRSIDNGYAWTSSNKDTLKRFLEWLDTRNDWNELIILGDMFEEWICRPDMPTLADSDGNILTEGEFFSQLVSFHKDVFDILYKLKNKGRTLVYVPGNHDMQTTREDFEKYLPGLFEFRQSSAGLGEYTPDGHIYMEHGHRYDLMNAPYSGKVGIDDIPENSILPPGFFVARIQTNKDCQTSDKKDIPLTKSDEEFYDQCWHGLGLLFGMDSVLTMTDGMTKKYGFHDYAYSTAKLFNLINNYENWENRCMENGAYFTPDITTSISSCIVHLCSDTMAVNLLLNTSFKSRILVWGHSHEPKVIESVDNEKGKVIYLNTGCWCDSYNTDGKNNTCTFGEIKCKDGHYSAKQCRYDIGADGSDIPTTVKEANL